MAKSRTNKKIAGGLRICSLLLLQYFLVLMLTTTARVSAFRLVAPQKRNIKLAVLPLYTASAPLQSTTTYECIFDIQVPEGHCVGLRLPEIPEDHPDALVSKQIILQSANNEPHHWIYDHLHTDEIQYGLELGRKTQASFWIGRMAMREALSELAPCSVSTRSILKDAHGRPQLPPGFLGSISHKRNTGVALVAPAVKDYCTSSNESLRIGIGVDIEESTPKRRSVARKVLTPNEQKNLGLLPVCLCTRCARSTVRYMR